MRIKRIIGLLCAVSITFMSGISSYAEELPEVAELSVEEGMNLENIDDGDKNLAGLSNGMSSMLTGKENVSLTEDASISQKNYNLDLGVSMGDLTTRQNTRSAASITQEFTDFITAEGDYKFVQFS